MVAQYTKRAGLDSLPQIAVDAKTDSADAIGKIAAAWLATACDTQAEGLHQIATRGGRSGALQFSVSFPNPQRIQPTLRHQPQAGSEFNPQQSENNAKLTSNPREKQRLEVTRGVHGISLVTFAYSLHDSNPACERCTWVASL